MTPLRLAVALSLLAAPLAAQGTIDPHKIFRIRPNSCPMADSLAGRPLTRPGQPAFGWAEGNRGQVVSNGVWELSARRPLDAIIITATYDGIVPQSTHPDAVFAMQIRMKDTALRQGADAELTLIFDDSDTTVVGDMVAEATALARERRVDQMLTQALRPSTVRRLAAATSLRGRLGRTEFEVPPRTLEQMRAAFIAATCGTDIK